MNKFVVTSFGENADAAWNTAQKALAEMVGPENVPAGVVILPHPVRFGPTKFAGRLLDGLAADAAPKGISKRHQDLVTQATEQIRAGVAVGFVLHGGSAAEVREKFSAQRVQGQAYLYFGLAAGTPATPAAVLAEMPVSGPEPEWADPE